jgi:hypothetical protein
MNDEEADRHIIAIKKEGKQNPDAGLITPLAFIEPDGSYTSVNEGDFPRAGDIFIRSGYTDCIDDVYEENEPFKLTHYFEVDIYDDNPNTAKFRADARHYDKSNIESLNSFELCQIIDVPYIPSPSNPYIGSSLRQGIVFLFDQKDIVGPFEISEDSTGKCKLSAAERTNLRGLNTHHVFVVQLKEAINNHLVEIFEIKGKKYKYVKNVAEAAHLSTFKKMDFISDEQLLNWGANQKFVSEKSSRPTRKILSAWRNAIADIKNLSGEFEDRRKRLLDLLAKIDSIDEDWSDKLRTTLSENTRIIDAYIKRNEEVLLTEATERLKGKAESEAKDIQLSINKLKKDRDSLKSEIANFEADKKILEEKKTDELIKDLTAKENDLVEKINNREETLKTIENELNVKKNTLNIIIDVEELKKEVEYQKRRKKNLEAEIEAIEDKKLPESLAKIKAQLDILHGVHSSGRQPIRLTKRNSPECNPTPENPRSYVEALQQYLEENCNRNLELDEVANLLIVIQNNFLVVLSGPPGVGKTSIAYLLSEALGLKEEFLPISVARGWTSQRDLLGYFNPINSSFQPARTGLYHFLKHGAGFDESVTPYNLILLDEANLSPIEHYWADFLAMCDGETCRQINVGSWREEDNFEVADQVRFIATINNDNTTERLSHRLIDRAAIVSLPELDLRDISPYASEGEKFDISPFSYAAMKKMFSKPEEQIDFSDIEKDNIDKIVDVLTQKDGSQRVLISPRKYNAMKKFCSIARDVFLDASPLDYAISQFLLPSIEGFGEDYGNRLLRLQKQIDKFPKSKSLLQDILERGEKAHHSYSFFV